MAYLYKLVETRSLEQAKNNIISFTRPFYNYDYEGNFIKFAKSINERFKIEKELIKPTKEDLEELTKWKEAFKNHYGKQVSDEDLLSDSKIIFCRLFSFYCGYFTYENLFDEDIRKEYIKNNQHLIKNSNNPLDNKIAVIRINEDGIINYRYSSKYLGNSEEPFIKSDVKNKFNGYLKTLSINYSEKYDDYDELFKRYYKVDYFDTKAWIDTLPKSKETEKERRISFSLESLEPSQTRIACDEKFKPQFLVDSLESKLFKAIIDALLYSNSDKVPDRLYLKLNPRDIDIIEFDE